MSLDTDPVAYKTRYGDEALIRLLERLEKGLAPGKFKKKRKQRKDKKRKLRKRTKAQKREQRYGPVQKMAADFYQTLATTVDGRNVICCERRTQAVAPGRVYLVDRTEKGVYINIYMRQAKGRDCKLVVMRLAPINGGLDFQLPDVVQPADLPADLRWASWAEPPMFSVVRTLKTAEHYRWMAERLAASTLQILGVK